LLRSPFFPDGKIYLFRLVIVSSVAWVVQLYGFVRAFMKLPVDSIFKIGNLALFVSAVLCVAGIIPPSINFSNGSVNPEYGWWLVLYIAPISISAIKGMYTLFRRLMHLSSPEERNIITYLISAIGFFAIFGFAGVTPLANHLPLSHIGSLFAAVILTYAVVQHELLSISLIFRRALGWASVLIIGVVLYEFLLLGVHYFNGTPLNLATMILPTLAGIVVVYIIFYLRPIFLRKIDQVFYKQGYEHRKKLYEFVSHQILGVSSLDELSEGLLNPLIKALNCQQSFILLPDKNSGHFLVKYSIPWDMPYGNIIIRQGSPILEFLKDQHLTRKDLDIRPEFQGLWKEELAGINIADIELLFPFINRGKTIGILALSRKKSGKYSVDDINLVENITNSVAMSLEKERYHGELVKREKELSVINRLTNIINSNLNIQDVYETFIEGLREVVDIDFATIGKVDNINLELTALYNKNNYPIHLGDTLKLQHSGLEWVILRKKCLIYPNSNSDDSGKLVNQLLSFGLESLVLVPLIHKNETVGILILGNSIKQGLSEEQVQFIEQVASQISTAVVNSQLYASAETRARIDELTGLYNRRHFDESIEKEIRRDFRYGNSFTLMMLDVDNFKNYNDTQGHIQGDKLLKNVAQVIRNSIREVDLGFRYGGDEFAVILPNSTIENAVVAAERVRKKIEKDMRDDGNWISVSIGLANWPSNGLVPQDVITAADRALYYAKNTGANRSCTAAQILPSAELSDNQPGHTDEKQILNTIYALAATIEARDRYTYGHSRKVRSFAVDLAEAIKMAPEKVTVISHAALLHDIGKIGIYDTILNKPEELTFDERELIKKHPQLSRDIIAHIPNLTPCLPAILHHHERWDGKGYPHGLKGEKIPMEARILTIADSFDAMISARPYRDPLPAEKVIEELKRCAGSQFDPNLVPFFLPIAFKALNIESASTRSV
jgi:diguanylate cyclase (GGDEF)-like protein